MSATFTEVIEGEIDAVVIGAGFAGMYMNVKLRDEMSMSVQVFEAADDVGGTWYWNRYPGARCDSESYIYCYSFDRALMQEWDWSGKYPEQPEILRYLNHVADRHDIRRNVKFGTRVESMTWDDVAHKWTVQTDRGDSVIARYVITAIGCLSSAQVPDIPGLDSFEGEWYHTGAWPHEGVDFTGKRVGVIGTGSSGVQSIPVIAKTAGHLTVFQRTPQFMVPARHGTVDKTFLDDVKTRYDEVYEACRRSAGGHPYPVADRSALSVSEGEREKILEEFWQAGGFRFVLGTFNDITVDPRANAIASAFIRNKIREIVKDPEVAATLVPIDHPFGAKRALIDTDYFDTYNRDNVSLVDIRHAPIVEITPTGIHTTDADYEIDIIVFATGFDAMTGPYNRMDITGRDGVKLREMWADGPHTYLGAAVAGLPNLFTITGPGSPSVLSNMPVSIEQHVEFYSELIQYMREHELEVAEADATAQEEWTAHVNEVASQTLYMLADSWYLGANIPGKPRVFMPYAGGVGAYRERCEQIARANFTGFTFIPTQQPATTP